MGDSGVKSGLKHYVSNVAVMITPAVVATTMHSKRAASIVMISAIPTTTSIVTISALVIVISIATIRLQETLVLKCPSYCRLLKLDGGFARIPIRSVVFSSVVA